MELVTLDTLVSELASHSAGAQVKAITLARVMALAAENRVSLPLGVHSYFMTAADADTIRAAYKASRARR